MKRRGRRFPVVVAGAIVVLGAGIAAWWLWPEGETRRDAASMVKQAHIKEVKPAAAPKAVEKEAEKAPVVTNGAPAWVNAKGLDPSLFPYTDGRKVLSTRTNNWDQVIDICMMPNGVRRKVLRNAKPPTYDNVSDQLLSMALSGDGDDELPPLPIPSERELEEAFVESMKKPIVIKDDDSEAIKESKRRVIEARAIMDEQLKQGKSYRQILEQHIADRNQGAKLREEAMSGAIELKKSGDTEGLNEYLKSVNEFLDSHGVRGIEMKEGKKKRIEQ